MKKLLSVLLATAMMATALAGCGGSEATSGTASTDASTSTGGSGKNVTLEVMMPSHPTYQYNPEWALVKKVQEETGVTLDIDAVLNSGESFDEKLNLAMVGGNLPDLIYPISNSAVKTYGDDGAFINILDHMDKLPNFSAWYAENKDKAISFMSADGSLYQFPSVGQQESNRRAWLYRQDIFEANNLEVPTTSDELYEVLKKLKELYPDSYPLSFRQELAQFDVFAPAFGTSYMLSTRYMNLNEDGEYEFGPIQDEFKEMAEFFNKLYEEELIVPNFLSIDTTGWEELIANEQSFITIDYIGRIDFFNNKMAEVNPDFTMSYMAPFAGGSNGVQTVQDCRTGYYGYIITSQTKHLDEALAYCDWWFSEEGMETATWGVEGVHYDKVDGKNVWKDSVTDVDTLKINEGIGTYGFYQACDYGSFVQLFSPELKAAYEEAVKYDAATQPVVALNEDETKFVTTKVTPLVDYVEEQISKFLTGQKDFSEWDDYVATVESMGLDEMKAMYETAYARMTQ